MTNNEGRFSKGNRRKRLLAGLLAALVAGLFLVGCGDSDSANHFTVEFDAAGGSPVPETQLVPRGQTATPPGEVTRGTETFYGWVDTQTNETFSFSTPILQNYRLRAVFSSEGWTITFNTAGGDPIPPMTGLQNGYPVTDLPTPSRGGYDFQHWIDQDGFMFTNQIPVTRNITLTAFWNPEVGTGPGDGPGDGTGPGDAPPVVLRTVTFNPNGGAAVSPATRNVPDGTAVGGLPTTSRTGYILAGWFTAQTGGVQVNPNTQITANVTFWARWNPRFNNWTTRLQNPNAQWGGTANINDVAFGSNHFIAVGDGGRMAISTDGHNWAMLNNNFPSGHPIHAIAFHAGWFIAGGGGGNMLRFRITGNAIAEQQLIPPGTSTGAPGTPAGQSGFAANEAIRGIAGGIMSGATVGAWVAVGDNGRISRMGLLANGFSRVTSGTNAQLNDVAFANFNPGGGWSATFVAVGNNGTMLRSTNVGTGTPGTTWAAVNASGFNTNQHIQGIAFGNGRFIAVGGSNPNVTSHSNITAAGWTSGTAGTFPLYSVAYGDGVWFVGGGGPARLMRSIDNGINWVRPNFTSSPDPFNPVGAGPTVRGITFGADRFAAVAGTQLRTGWAAE